MTIKNNLWDTVTQVQKKHSIFTTQKDREIYLEFW